MVHTGAGGVAACARISKSSTRTGFTVPKLFSCTPHTVAALVLAATGFGQDKTIYNKHKVTCGEDLTDKLYLMKESPEVGVFVFIL